MNKVKATKRLINSFKTRVIQNVRPSLNDLDRKLEEFLNYEYGFFIEAGANDGYTQSNTYYLENKRGWKGVLVEGIPDLYNQCKKKRPKSLVYNYALVSDIFSDKNVTMHYANLMSVVDGALKTREEQDSHLLKGIDIQNLENSYSVDVPAITLESILDDIPSLPQIDFFSLDVEGYELDVLKGLNLKKYRPKYILVEARFFNEIEDFMSFFRYGMSVKLSDHDYLYRDLDGRFNL